jgi:tetrahydromethanopterin S-methyltransferase subunit G
MGFIEEGRQLIQDFFTPEIGSIDARLSAVEKKLESFENKADKRFDSIEAKIDRVQATLDNKIDRNHSQVMETLHRMETYSQILERLARVESKLQHVA